MPLRRAGFFAALLALLLATRLAYSGALWEGDVLPLASALQVKHGAVLYRDVWYDKPPLTSVINLLWGAQAGIPIRLGGAFYSWLACLLAWALASVTWSRREGDIAAALLAFFLVFDTHSGVIPLAADMLLLVPHLAAMLFVTRRQPFLAGVAAGIGFLFNAKALFVLAALAFFSWPDVILLAAGFAAPVAGGLLWMFLDGSLTGYIDQVWHWSSLYAASPVVSDPLRNGVIRTAAWLGFHGALLLGALVFWVRKPSWRYFAWTLICYAGVVAGWRFFPRYFVLLLPPILMAAARGLADRPPRWLAALAAAALLVPLVRFGSPYLNVNRTTDLAMDRDSRKSATAALATGGKTLYVWGYRPELYVYTDMKPASRWLDSQALTGVPADRHLTQSRAVVTEGTAESRKELARSSPDVIIDGLGLYNPSLTMDHYPELREWMAAWREVARTNGTVIYTRR